MKKYSFCILFISVVFQYFTVAFAADPFRFALFTDLHITANKSQPSEDLQNAITDVNAISDIDFVLVSGDITQIGDSQSLKEAKQLLDKLHMPYYIIPGNHDFKWNESGPTLFNSVFGDDKFSFTHKGIKFIGFATIQISKGGNGYILKQDIDWMKSILRETGKKMPVFTVTHFPLQQGDVDNWFEMTDVLRKYNVQAVLGGHYHRNAFFNYDGISGIIHRSTLRGKDSVGGYSILSVSDSIRVYEKIINQPQQIWLTLPFENKSYGKPNPNLHNSIETKKHTK